MIASTVVRAAAILLVVTAATAAFAQAQPATAGPAKPSPLPEVLFTFDDGPAIGKTQKVLDLLDQHGIKAVFFVNGWHLQGNGATAEKSRELLREVQRRGHAIGNHTIHHYFLCGHTYIKQAWQEIEGNAKLIEEAIGVRPDLFRTPYGAHCKGLSTVMAGLGIKNTGWDIDPQDWKLRNAPKIEAFVEKRLATLQGRQILLLHDIHQETVDALPHILDWIDQENARRAAGGGLPPIKVINYAYLMPERKLLPPFLDALGRVLVDLANMPSLSPVPLWPGHGPPLAWPPDQV
jgi:peptidoglycan-N-acetylglucosamine deacetylase